MEVSASFCYSVTPVWAFIATAGNSGCFPGSYIMLVSAFLVINGHVSINSNWPWHHTFQGASLKPSTDQKLMS